MSAQIVFPPGAVRHVTFKRRDVGVELELATEMRGEKVILGGSDSAELLALFTRCAEALEADPPDAEGSPA